MRLPESERSLATDRACGVEMLTELLEESPTVCGREIYDAPEGMDAKPVCLMHSKDTNKDTNRFQREIERIVRGFPTIANFAAFVFPRDWNGEVVDINIVKCCFRDAEFHGNPWFGHGLESVDFSRSCFIGGAYFLSTVFEVTADFSNARFMNEADFNGANFAGDVDFDGAVFVRDSNFGGAVFSGNAHFFGCEFQGKARFDEALFSGDVDFRRSLFSTEASFVQTDFKKVVYFDLARFRGSVGFRETKFRSDGEAQPGPVFRLARFSEPEETLFWKVDLGQALFHRCDVSVVTFSSVKWRRRAGSGRAMVFEEVVDVKSGSLSVEALKPEHNDPNERKYSLIAELYQQLKKNYDSKGDYWPAGDFHYGEMEMKRLYSSRHNWVLRAFHRHMGLVAWYRLASQYGESYWRPAVWLLLVIAIAASIYPLAGLERKEPNGVLTKLTYSSKPTCESKLSLIGNSFVTAFSIAALQKELRYEPAYPGGRIVELSEALLTSTLIALFLLALRRQFKR